MPAKQQREVHTLKTLLKRFNPNRKLQATSVLALFFGNQTERFITVETALAVIDQAGEIGDMDAYLEGNSIFVYTADRSPWRAFELQAAR